MKLAACAVLTACAAPAPGKDLPFNRGAAMVDVVAVLEPGYVTIVDFWSESCGACAIVGGKVTAEIAHDPRVLFRRVDVGDGFTPVAHKYEINALPQYNVYDRQRRLRYVLVANDCLRAPELARALLAEP